jgi:hypothetical protein
VVTDDLRAAQRALDHAPAVSRRVADVADDAFGFDRGFVVRDPDGHALAVVSGAVPAR